jgi:hypothetical protein
LNAKAADVSPCRDFEKITVLKALADAVKAISVLEAEAKTPR